MTPVEALHKLAQLDGRKPAVTEDEDRLFQDARAGKFDRCSFSEACLVAGGVTARATGGSTSTGWTPSRRSARKATAGSKSVADDGARLLHFLHAGPMAKGYKNEQSDLHALLDTGEFNCVSSAVLYTVMGQRLGIDVRAVQVPGTCSPSWSPATGRSTSRRPTPAGSTWTRSGGTGPAQVDRPGSAGARSARRAWPGSSPSTTASTLIRDKRYAESVRANLFALGLDPDSRDAATNLVAALDRWAVDLTEAGKYEKAMAVVSVGRELVPGERAFQRITVRLCDAWAKGIHRPRGLGRRRSGLPARPARAPGRQATAPTS